MKRLVEIMTFSPEFATDELAQLRADDAAARPDHLENFLAGIRAGRGPVPAAATPEEAMSIQAPRRCSSTAATTGSSTSSTRCGWSR